MEVSLNNMALIETLKNYARYIIPLKWSLVCGMNEIFMGQFFVIFNFLFIFLLQTGRFLLGSMHVALDFQILTGNYLRLINFFEEMERLNDLKVQSNLVIRNFLVALKLFPNAKCSLSV